MIARVSLEIALRKEFDYLIPPGLARTNRGRQPRAGAIRPRKILGCVTALAEESAHANLKPILKVIGAQTLVTAESPETRALDCRLLLLRAGNRAEIRSAPKPWRREESGWRERLFVRAADG